MDYDLASQINAIEYQLIQVGYHEPNGAVVHDYEFLIGNGETRKADLIAFANPRRHDISTACIAVTLSPNGHTPYNVLEELSYVGAPLAIIAHKEHVEVLPVLASNNPYDYSKKSEEVKYEDLAVYVNQHRNELSPRQVLNAKRGNWQPSFYYFDPTLEAFARDATKKALVDQFDTALNVVIKHSHAGLTPELVRIAIWVLSSRILQDKLVDFDDLKTRNVFQLLNALKTHFPNYFYNFDKDLEKVGSNVVETLYDYLGGNFTFRSLTNEMLAGFYEDILITPDLKKELGIFYTPHSIAEKILQRLPVEDLPPEKRVVFDGTCGSGNLLLAAYDRLSNLLPQKWNAEKRHNYLLSHIWGLDKDFIACEVARLSLLLYDLPMGNSWKIYTGNVFEVEPSKMFGGNPGIIVGNPPYAEPRPVGSSRAQTASQILERYMNWLKPGGLLGVVLPITFLQNASSADARNSLLTNFDVFEIWNLPEHSISNSTSGTAVILAKKLESPRSNSSFPYALSRIDYVTKKDRISFLQNQSPSVSNVVNQSEWFNHPTKVISNFFFKDVLAGLEKKFNPIYPSIADIRNGVKVGKAQRRTHLSYDWRGEGWRPALIRNKKSLALQPFVIDWEQQEDVRYIKYPSSEIERPRKPEHFEIAPKVIINGARNPSTPWRIYAAIDRNRLVVSENFHYALPKGATTEVLCAVLNSMIVNLWFSINNYQRDVSEPLLKRIPFPSFTDKQSSKIRSLVEAIEEAVKNNPSVPPSNNFQKDIFWQLDEIIFDAYQVSKDDRKQIRKWMESFTRPGIWFIEKPSIDETRQSYQQNYQVRTWKVTGLIESVQMDKTISIWVEGRGSDSILIPSTLPGWALRPNVAFTATIPWEERFETNLQKLTWLNFSPVEFGYLSEEDLVLMLNENDN